MPKLAQFDGSGRVVGWYDTDAFNYPNLPAASELLVLTDAEWAGRLSDPSSWAVVNGALTAYVPPPLTLSQAQGVQIGVLRAACGAAILAGYSSAALGAAHSYPATGLDQQNMAASVLASLMPGLPAGWTTPFWCADGAGVWAMRDHTAAQIQAAGTDGKAAIVAAQVKLAGLVAQVGAAITVASVEGIVW